MKTVYNCYVYEKYIQFFPECPFQVCSYSPTKSCWNFLTLLDKKKILVLIIHLLWDEGTSKHQNYVFHSGHEGQERHMKRKYCMKKSWFILYTLVILTIGCMIGAGGIYATQGPQVSFRSEERRVGKECRL